MQDLYSRDPRYSQGANRVDVESINILEIADEVAPADPQEEFRQFRGRYLSRRAATRLQWAIISLWESDEMDAVEAVSWLYECGFIKFHEADGKDADAFMQFYAVRERNRAQAEALRSALLKAKGGAA